MSQDKKKMKLKIKDLTIFRHVELQKKIFQQRGGNKIGE